MDRNTIIAIVLSVVVIVVGMTLQTLFMEPQMAAAAAEAEVSESIDTRPPCNERRSTSTHCRDRSTEAPRASTA